MNAFRSRRPGKYRPFCIPVALFAFTTMILSSGIFAGELPQKKDANQADEQIQIIAVQIDDHRRGIAGNGFIDPFS